MQAAISAPVATNRRKQLLASLLEKVGLKAGADRIEPRPLGMDRASLSSGQRRLWFLDQVAPGNPVYNVPSCFRIRGPLNVSAFERALNEIVGRHEILRTVFEASGSEPAQVILSELPIRLERVEADGADLRSVRSLAVKNARRPFALDRGPLIRATLFRLGEQDHVALITMHHIVCDGWSMGLLFRELAAFYATTRVDAPSMPIQYADYAVWQRDRLESGKLEPQIEFWREHLRDAATVFELPTDRQRSAEPAFRGAILRSDVDRSVSDALMEIGQSESATPFALFLAAYAALLYRYSGQSDFIIGCPVSNRTRAELEGVIGFLPNTLPLRMRISGDESFTDLLRRVRDGSTQAFANAEAPFEAITNAVGGSRSGQSSLFQVAYTMQEQPPAHISVGDVEISPMELDLGTAKCDLTLVGAHGHDSVSFTFEYSADLFEEATVRRMASHFRTLLEGIAADPDTAISDLPLMEAADVRQVVSEWSGTATAEPDSRALPELFEGHVSRQPDAPALVYRSEVTTYAELNSKADRVAQALRERGAGAGALVAIALERSPDLIAAILGAMKSGAAYLPIGLDHPAERICFQIEDARPMMLVTSAACRANLPPSVRDLGWLDMGQLPAASGHDVTRPRASDLAYVIYTSGSTGKPKGAMLEHGGLTNLALAQQTLFDIGPGERVLQFAPPTFDASVWEIAMALGSGACLCLGSGATFVPEELTRALREQHVTAVTLPPSLLRVLRPEDVPDLRTIISAGEDCPVTLAQEWSRNGRRFFNGYGPTETTVCATVAVWSTQADRISIGRPLPNVRAYILDSRMKPVPVGVPGELHVGGLGVARGYLNRPELTRARFVRNPFTGGGRLYKTGDLARWRPNGEIEFLGRIDGQVKIRGHRIEPGEIEARLSSHPAVRECAVVVRQQPGHDDRLIAYYVPLGDAGDLRAFVAEAVPQYMVPSAFVPLSELPVNPSGKIDRRALSRLEPGAQRDSTAARDELESAIARVWCDVLGLRTVGVRDNFFELGGNSLMAVNLMARIAAETGCDLSVTALFQAGTVEQIAQLVRERRSNSGVGGGRLVKLQPKGSNPPLILIPPAGGSIICYSELARTMAPDQPVWGIEPGRESEHPSKVEAIAAHYIKELRAQAVVGPWRLAGWSFGGNVAYEMGRQLAGAGEIVEIVALIDSHAEHRGKEPEEEEILLEIARVQALARGAALKVDRRMLRSMRGRDGALLVASELERGSGVAPETIARELRTIVQRFRSDIRAGRRYSPGVYSGRVALLRTPGALWIRDNGWTRLCPALEIYPIAGAHRTVLAQPHVADLGNRLRDILQ